MTTEEFKAHTFEKDEVVLVGGKSVDVVSASLHSLMVRYKGNHYKTVLQVEVELIDGGSDVEFR